MKTVTFLLAIMLFTTSCVPSLNALYTEHDVTHDSALVGVWTEKETGDTWALSRGDKLEYALVHTDGDGLKGEYIARLVKVDDKLFLDIVPAKPGFTQNDLYKEHYLAAHTFVHVGIKGSVVQLSYLEPRWLKDFLAENPDAMRHASVGGQIVLTSSPKETQKFLLAHLNTRGAFSQPAELVRKRGV
jgi:hypothetical protein